MIKSLEEFGQGDAYVNTNARISFLGAMVCRAIEHQVEPQSPHCTWHFEIVIDGALLTFKQDHYTGKEPPGKLLKLRSFFVGRMKGIT
jgi:hypothetical protein